MSEIINSLNKVSARLSEEAFLSNKGLSNEVGIHVFCYDPKDELTVRAYFDTLKKQQDVPYNLIERDLYKIFLEICEGKRILKSIPNMEARKGKEYLSEQLQKVATPEAFVEKMNAKAKELGMNDTVFKNPTGLTEEGHLTTPYDMSIIGRHLVQDYPEIIEFSGLYEDYIRQDTESPFWLVNTNKLLKYVDGVDGLKTGYTQEAGYCLTATANRGEMRVIAVVMGASKSDIRNQEVTRLIEYAYGQYELIQKLEGQKVVSNGYNMLAKNRSFEIVTSEPVTVLKKKTDAEQESKYDLSLNEEIKLPIQPGDQVGTLTYYYNGKAYKEIPLTVKEPVEKNSFIGLLGYIVSQILFGENA